MTPKGIYRKYGARMRRYMRSVRDGLKGAGLWATSPHDTGSKDEFACVMSVKESSHASWEDNAVDITFRVLESEEWDGSEGGVSFGVDAVSMDGREIAKLAPYNYSSRVWVDRMDPHAVDERFLLVEGADPGELVYLVAKYFGKEA